MRCCTDGFSCFLNVPTVRILWSSAEEYSKLQQLHNGTLSSMSSACLRWLSVDASPVIEDFWLICSRKDVTQGMMVSRSDGCCIPVSLVWKWLVPSAGSQCSSATTGAMRIYLPLHMVISPSSCYDARQCILDALQLRKVCFWHSGEQSVTVA